MQEGIKSNAEIMIRKDIDNLDNSRLAYKVGIIKNDIKYAFWHGFIDEYIYNELMQNVSNKYNKLCEF